MTNFPHAVASVRLRFPWLQNDEVKKILCSGLKYYYKTCTALFCITRRYVYHSTLDLKLSSKWEKYYSLAIVLLLSFSPNLVSLILICKYITSFSPQFHPSMEMLFLNKQTILFHRIPMHTSFMNHFVIIVARVNISHLQTYSHDS